MSTKVRLLVEHTFKLTSREGAFLLARPLDGATFRLREGATIDGRPIASELQIPRVVGPDGQARLDVYSFRLLNEAHG